MTAGSMAIDRRRISASSGNRSATGRGSRTHVRWNGSGKLPPAGAFDGSPDTARAYADVVTRRHFGNVRKLPSGRYQASYWHEGQRHVAPDTFLARADALAYLSTVETDLLRGDWRAPEPARETFGAYGKRWLVPGMGRLGSPLSPTTAELYEVLWRKWLEPTFGNAALGTLTPEAWRPWYIEQTAKHPGSTQPGKAYRLARAILNQAVDDGLLRVNPCRVKGAGRDNSPERPSAMPDQVAAIAASIKPANLRAMVLLGAYCSLRFGELAGLRRSRIDLLHRTVVVAEQAVELRGGKVVFKEPKSESQRTVAIPADLVAILEQHLEDYVRPETDALVFTSPEGHPIRRTKFRSNWAAACAAAGVEALHFHDLRGSGATWAATAGATVRELMARLGHKTERMAIRYQQATLERDQAIVEKLGALMRVAETAQPATNLVPIERHASDSYLTRDATEVAPPRSRPLRSRTQRARQVTVRKLLKLSER